MGSRWRGCSGGPPNLEPWEEMGGDGIRFVSPNGCALAAETGGDQGQDTGHLGQPSGGDGWPNSDGAEKPLRGHPDGGGASETCRQGQSVASRMRQQAQTDRGFSHHSRMCWETGGLGEDDEFVFRHVESTLVSSKGSRQRQRRTGAGERNL